MRYCLLAALLVVACGGDDTGSSSSSSSGPGGGGGMGGAGGTGAGSAKCDADPSLAHVDALQHLGRGEGDTFIEVLDVVQDHPIVYACTSVKGLNIWDASADGPPTLLQTQISAPTPGGGFPHCQHVGLDRASKELVITNRGDEIQPQPFIWLGDFSNVNNPLPTAGWFGPESIEGAVLDAGRVWAAAHSAGILVIDHTGSGQGGLTEVARFSDAESDAWMPLKHGDYLLVAEGYSGLRIYDITQDTPALVASVPIDGSSKDVVVQDNVAYVAASSRIAAIDITDPSNPSLLGEVETTGTAIALAIGLNDTVLVAEWDKLRGYDISDPANMKQELSEVMPLSNPADAFTRVLTVDAAPDVERAYPGAWKGLMAYKQVACGVGPDVEATPGSVAFGSLNPGELDVRALILRNNGNRPLEIENIASVDPALTFSQNAVTIEPGSAEAVEITYQPTNTTPMQTMLTIASNDLDESPFELVVSGNIPGVDIGDPLPLFSLQDTEGTTWSNADLAGKVSVLAYFATF